MLGGRCWPKGRHYENFFIAPVKSKFQSGQQKLDTPGIEGRVQSNEPCKALVQQKGYEPILQTTCEYTREGERGFLGEPDKKG